MSAGLFSVLSSAADAVVQQLFNLNNITPEVLPPLLIGATLFHSGSALKPAEALSDKQEASGSFSQEPPL